MNKSEIAERAAREIRRHFDEDFDTTIPGEVFDRELVQIVERAIAESQARQPKIKVHLDMCPKCTGSKDMPLCNDMFHSPAGVRQTNDVPAGPEAKLEFQPPPDSAPREEIIGALQYWVLRAKKAERAIAESQAWISVEEKLPEHRDEQILTVTRKKRIEMQSAIFWRYLPDSYDPVTHWAHLPEPPKGNENV